jgi:tetratricopeptide (TPR) repeat protein
LNDLGRVAQVRGELEQAQRYYQDALGLFRELNAPEGQAEALRELGSVSQKTGDFVLAASYLQEALTLFQAIGAKLEMAKTGELLSQVRAQLAAAEP